MKVKQLPWKVRKRESGSDDPQTWYADTPFGRFTVYQPLAYRKEQGHWYARYPGMPADIHNFASIGIPPKRLVGTKEAAMSVCQTAYERQVRRITDFCPRAWRTITNMKRLTLILVFGLFAVVSLRAQCAPGSVCVPQQTIDRAAQAASELIEARKVIQEFTKERAATDAERAASAKLIDGLNALVTTKDRIETEQNKIIDLYKQTVILQQEIIERLEKRLMAPKSGWNKFTATLEKVALILVGVALKGGL